MKKITYKASGVDYTKLDPIKKLAQEFAKKTSVNFTDGYRSLEDTRGESAFVWKQGDVLMASVMEGLGTKTLVADAVFELTGKSYYSSIAQDTVATIINDLVSIGAKPLVLNAYWADAGDGFLQDPARMKDFVKGWAIACNLAGVVWGGGETPTLKGIITEKSVDLGGSSVGIIEDKEKLITDKKMKAGDRIVLIKSNGVNANGISLARAIAKKLPKGYGTKMQNGKLYGESLLTKSNIYAKVIQDLQKANIDIHYISNITGHGIRKVMRGRPTFTYVLERIFKPQPLFDFIAQNAGIDDYEMYQTYNMGQDYCLIIPQKDVEKTLKIIEKNNFKSLNAGYVERGEKQVIIKTKNLVYKSETLDLR
jgi:phosphoribosylformylglycinamidine cyclo-ligase